MARKQCQVCGQPATVRVEANLNGRNSTMLLCDDHYRQLVRQQKRTVSPLEALFGSRSGLFEDFLGSDFFRIGEDATPVAADTDDVVDASFGEPATAGSGAPRRRGSGLASRISEQSEALLQEAAKHAAEFGRSEVDTEHLLLALADSDVVKTILGQFKIKVDDLKRQIESEAKRGDKPFEGEIGVSPRVKDALSRAFVASNELGHSYVGPEHFLIGLAEEGEGLAANLLRRYGLTPQALRQQVSKVVGKGAEDGRAETPTNTPELDKYSRDLTKMARDGKLDPVIGRAQEIETTIEVLARRKKNNPVLIGEPGVGKTAIVEGLAQRMVAGEVPETLRDKRLVELNINAMVAGAKYRGEFEERVQKVLKEVTEHQGELILFIDEVHTIVGAGQGGGEGGLDVANVFKPMMARGELNLIGATTLNEYQKSLYGTHHGWLKSWLTRKLQSAFDADDIAQDTFLRVMSSETLSTIRDPRSFLCTIAKRVMVDLFRRNALEKAYLEMLALMPEGVAPSPEERESQLETLQLVDSMLDGLNGKTREAFLLSQLDGLTYSEIAHKLGVSVSSVKKYVAKAVEHCLLFRLEHGL